jgi:hypothetical protein
MTIARQRFGNTSSRGNGYAGKSQSVATRLTHVSWQRIKHELLEVVLSRRFAAKL